MKLKAHERTARRWLVALAALLVIAFFASFYFGRYGVAPGKVVGILLSRFFAVEADWTPQMQTAVLNIRLPRILLVCLVGCSLAAAGAAYQGVFRNPMAAPDILGASSGAAFGAALAILLGFGTRGIMLLAFALGLATVLLVYLVGSRAPGQRAIGLILAGIMLGSLMSAGTSFVKLVADPSNELPAITYWLMGSLSGAMMRDVGFAALPMAIGLIPLFLLRWRVNLLTLGDDEARSLGVDARALRLIVIVCATLVTAASVAVSGMIGWVGLVVPHLCRKMVGSDYRRLMPASMLTGALFLLLVDDVARNLLSTEIPIGILTAFLGAPVFLYFILKGENTP